MLLPQIRFLLCVLLALTSCKDRVPVLPPLPADAVIVAFGDSLTVGIGAAREESYPAFLEKLISRRVINAGVSGEETAGGLARLPSVIREKRPQLILLCLGGNDFLRRRNHNTIKSNLKQMLELLKQNNIPAVLVAVPELGLPMFLSDAELYQELAKELGVPLLAETLTELETDNEFKADSIHLNGRGYQRLAESIAAFLRQSGAL